VAICTKIKEKWGFGVSAAPLFYLIDQRLKIFGQGDFPLHLLAGVGVVDSESGGVKGSSGHQRSVGLAKFPGFKISSFNLSGGDGGFIAVEGIDG
jgi:hypothetical protein